MITDKRQNVHLIYDALKLLGLNRDRYDPDQVVAAVRHTGTSECERYASTFVDVISVPLILDTYLAIMSLKRHRKSRLTSVLLSCPGDYLAMTVYDECK